ncbi:DUF2235 domain-containing protein [Alteromonas lipolytica]|uniref:T6SS Phospholipase effector Tle1-like catalytic domain-containing protein n=1 Tax=Alteromonas lipolytica TaxID=1856405 RepID=A0A1E8FGX2_9ALTE|nr:DUF2235 domain-containing protein [Alteromonas lipolytica]OFI35192.1 hypothetical protein BFC17_16765 [Alteromonas lipolytica]GGF57504.1 hypothetical protein GCM10011338_07180 [Alteromonas lipolytica]
MSEGRNLVVCCDGTWNSSNNMDGESPAPTNVHKLFSLLETDDPQQLTRYQAGVGTEGYIDQVTGGLLGIGINEDIRDCYQWLSDKYQPGDRIFLFGFSRGAFAARSLSGLITKAGLIDFKKTNANTNASRQDIISDLYHCVYNDVDIDSDYSFHPTSQGIYFIGVWDTVGSLGIPDDKAILDLFDNPDKYKFHNTKLSEFVKYARHAVALDERRSSFSPTLWTEIPEVCDVKQIWFPGVHSNIGGGYKETGLSDCTLLWMIEELKELPNKLLFDMHMVKQIIPNPFGRLHNSYSGVMKVLRSLPRAIPNILASKDVSEYARLRFQKPPIQQGKYLPHRQFVENKVTVDVYAKHRWYWTGIYLEKGVYECTAEGEWVDRTIPCSPKGMNDGKFHIGELVQMLGTAIGWFESAWNWARRNEHKDDLISITKRIEDADWFTLIGVIANQECPKQDGDPPPPQIEVIGDSAKFTVNKPGYLYCFANDVWAMYDNNRGYVTLTVEVLPSTE